MKRNAKRASRPNPREDRNQSFNSRSQKSHANSNVIPIETEYRPRAIKKKVEIIPRNLAQETYVDTLYDESKDIVFAMGPAGTGKSLLATLYAIQELQAGNIDKIIVTRPAVSTDESHGYLPGTLQMKLAPWCQPILDIFQEHYSPQAVEKMLEDGVLELAGIGFLRGRTFKRAIIILDEMQSSTVSQMKMVLTRIGDDSRMFITGDVRQHERGFEENGLKDFVARMRNHKSSRIALCEFAKCDVERHPVIDEVLSLYGE